MKYREKLGYIALGGGLMLVGVLAAGLFSPLGAQSKSDVSFGKITCTELEVADPDGTKAVRIFAHEHGGIVQMFGKDGESDRDSKVSMLVNGHGGQVLVAGKKGGTHMGVNNLGGVVSVSDRELGPMVGMGISEHGGPIHVFGKDENPKVDIGVIRHAGEHEGIVIVFGEGKENRTR